MQSKLLSSKTVKIRKPRVCFGCGREFPIDTAMQRDCLVDGDTVFSMYLCDDCIVTMDKINGEEFGFGELADDLHERQKERTLETYKLLSKRDYYLIQYFKAEGLTTIGSYKGILVFRYAHHPKLGTVDIEDAIEYVNQLPHTVKDNLLDQFERDTRKLAEIMLGHCVDFQGDLYSYQISGGVWTFTRDLDFAIKAQTSYLESEIKEVQ